MTEAPQGPLTGIRVIGLEQYISGPCCTMLPADAGEVEELTRDGVVAGAD